MFTFIRKKNIVKSILLLLAISLLISMFILWGSQGSFKNPQSSTIGIIFGKKISQQVFMNSYKASYILSQISYDEDFYKIKDLINFNAQAWDRLIILEAAKRQKINITDSELINYIDRFAMFQSKDGFSLQLYNLITQNLGLSKREFEEIVRGQLIIEKFYENAVKDVSISDDEVFQEYKKDNESVSIEIISIISNNFEDKIEVNLEEAKKYHDEHSNDFKEPDKVNVQYIGFEFNKDTSKETKQETKSILNEVYLKLKKIKDIDRIAKEYSYTVEESGFFAVNEAVSKLGWFDEFAQKAFSLTKSSPIGFLETNRGCYILSLKETKPAHIPEFENVKDKVIAVLKKNKAKLTAKEEAAKYKKEIEEKLNKNSKLDLEKWAQDTNLKYIKQGDFKRNAYLQGIGFSAEAEAFAFDLAKNGISEVIEGTAGFYLLRRIDFNEIDENKFNEEKDKFKEQLLRQKKDIEFNKYLREKINATASLFIDLNQNKNPAF